MATPCASPSRLGSGAAAALVGLLLGLLRSDSLFTAPHWFETRTPLSAWNSRSRSPVIRHQASQLWQQTQLAAAAAKQLRQGRSEAAITQLERAWRLSHYVKDLVELQGRWRLQVPTTGNVRRWMHRHGVLLGMQLLSSPELTIYPDGQAVSRTSIRMGLQRDEVFKKSMLSLAEPNVVLERTLEVNSGRLKVGFPWMKQSNAIRITYLDKELMIIRDPEGYADVLWRAGGTANATRPVAAGAAAPCKEHALTADPEADSGNPQVAHGQVQRLSGQVEALRGSLEDQRKRGVDDRKEQSELTKKAAALEKALKVASVDARAKEAQLGALEVLHVRLLQEQLERGAQFAERASGLASLEAKAARLGEQLEEQRTAGGHAKAHETSLRAQAAQLAREAGRASRRGRPAYRAALAEVKMELRTAGQKSQEEHRTEVALKRELQRADAELGRQGRAVRAGQKEEASLKEMLEEQAKELEQRRVDASQASAKEEALSAELKEVRSRQAELERRGTESRGVAAQVERALRDVAVSVREARRTARNLHAGAHRIWPWR